MSDDLERIFASAGCTGQLCVQAAAGDQEIALGADQPAVAASVVKVLVAVEAERQFATGQLDPGERVTLPSGERTPGPAGFDHWRDRAATMTGPASRLARQCETLGMPG
jgi:beta-lactamase class A